MQGRSAQGQKAQELLKSMLERANALIAAGALNEAAHQFLEIAKIAPGNAGVFKQAGACFYNARSFGDAAGAFEKAYKLDPSEFETFKNLAMALMQGEKLKEAAALLRKRLDAHKNETITFELLGECLARLEDWDAILQLGAEWRKNNASVPYTSVAVCSREVDALIATGDPKGALTMLEGISAGFESNPDFWPVMGYVYGANRLFERELECHRKSYEHAPADPRFISNYGLALANLNRLDEAVALFDSALEANPLLANIYVNRAFAFKKLHRLEDSVKDLERALEINPVSAGAHYALGCAYVQLEDYARGWPHYEWNWTQADMPKFRPTTRIPTWYGEDLTDKHLLVFVEQGIGDTIMFARYVPLLKDKYGNIKISVICEEKLKNLLAASWPFVSEIMVKEDLKKDEIIKADYMVAFGSLPCVFETLIETVPQNIPYLAAGTPKNYRDEKTKLVVGITWYSKSLDAGYKRSLALESFAFLKDIPGVKVVDLQYGDTAEERAKAAETGLHLHHDDSVDPWTDIEGHMAQIAACDLVISVDNTTVHAAGALGKPCWTLLPYDSYWRWHLDRESTPWYPTMRLFRQNADRSFAPVLAVIESDLRKLVDGDDTPLRPAPFEPKQKTVSKGSQKALLINDTSATYHWGCTATSEALATELKAKGFDVESVSYLEINNLAYHPPSLQDFDSPLYLSEFRFRDPTLFHAIAKADKIVFNGEGTLHGINPNALRLLYLAYAAKTHFGKPVHIINHACFPEDGETLSNPTTIAFYLKGYRAADYVAVRDPISHKILNALEISNTLAFDSLPLTAARWLEKNPKTEKKKQIILAGSSKFSVQSANAYRNIVSDFKNDGYEVSVLVGAKISRASEDATFIDFMKTVAGNDVGVIDSKSMEEWFGHLASAALLVSGRFHYSIAAACVGTPFVAFEGNTPKLRSLCETLNEREPFSYTDPELAMKLRVAVTKALRAGPPEEAAVKEKLEKLCGLARKNFDAL